MKNQIHLQIAEEKCYFKKPSISAPFGNGLATKSSPLETQIHRSFLAGFFVATEETRDQKESSGGADGGVGDIEGGPMAIPREDDI